MFARLLPPPWVAGLNVTPRRLPGLTLGLLLLATMVAVFAVSLSRLGQEAISPVSLIWIGAMLVALPLTLLILNRLFGLLTARYRLDRDGLYLQWGLAYEQVPMREIQSIHRPDPAQGRLRPRFGFWWPGCLVGRTQSDPLGPVEFFATSSRLTLVERAEGGSLAISPPDPDAFRAGYTNALHMGALERIPARSERPEALLHEIWSDQPARLEIIAGLALPILLLVGLIVRSPALPAAVTFGFGPQAQLVPPGRLTLLPAIGGLVWLSDLVVGAWFYRRQRDRPLAYLLWGAAIGVGILLAGAALRFIDT